MNISIIVFLGDDTTKENYFKFFHKSHKFYNNKFNYFDKMKHIFYPMINLIFYESYSIHFNGKSFLRKTIINKIKTLNKKYFD